MDTVIIIDSNNALFRFGHAHKFLSHRKKFTGVVFGMTLCLLRLKRKYPRAKFVAAWDGGGNGWRHRLYPEYKGNREPGDTEAARLRAAILSQKASVIAMYQHLGIPQVSCAGVEGDDVVGILANCFSTKNLRVVIYSGDRDFLQLMTLRGVVLVRDFDKTKKLKPETEQDVLDTFGCHSVDVLKVRAIAGDKGDNIKNPVPLIGPKKAAKLVAGGVDPSRVNCKIGKKSVLGAVWPKVHLNWQVMRVVRELTDELIATQRVLLEELVREACTSVITETVRDKGRYLTFVGWLGSLGLVEALENRFGLWHIQRCARNGARRR